MPKKSKPYKKVYVVFPENDEPTEDGSIFAFKSRGTARVFVLDSAENAKIVTYVREVK